MSSFAQKLMKPHEFNIESVTFSEPKKFGDAGAKIVYMNTNASKISLYTPKMYLPFGLGKYTEPGKPPKFSLNASFGNMSENEKTKELYDKIKELDEKVIQKAQECSLLWFKKKTMSENVARELYSSTIKFSKDKDTGEVNTKYPPTMNIKVPYYNDGFECDIFDDKRNEIVESIEETIQKGQEIQAIVECSGIWFAGGKYGISWKLKQLKLYKRPDKLTCAFRDDDSDTEDGEETVKSEEEP